MTQCENDDYVHKYAGTESDVFTAKVNGHHVSLITTVTSATKIQVKVLPGNYSKGDTLTIYKNGTLLSTITIIECP